ncbi:hypothetical protein TCDM_10389 [Trypanosoma cruzi Dm28c]|uniref:Uncharacterized protein n=1 Tax=Trypanosoma cruzi Dm28c TaxID=1416333 RepID=V5BC56_TRYCR|nr:hypothetical protein TCDM_10389 [Trypanosoma cruzi Dm28c]
MPRVNTLLHPPPLPHRRPQSHRRVGTTMCAAPSCTERWAKSGHASPRSIFPLHKYCVPTQSSKQNQSAQTQPTPSLAEAHYSHGVTSNDTPAVAGCMKFPCQPCEKKQ